MDLTAMIEAGGANPLLLFILALALGALHGLEPGHSKTMMAAYIIAVHGTVRQAVLLGLSAAFSHSVIVWILAFAALSYGNELIGEDLEPYFMLASGGLVIGIGAWMLWRSRANARRSAPSHAQDHDHAHDHNHDHDHDHDHPHHHDHDHDHHHDAHAQAHAAEIQARLASGRTSTWQTILFGLSGGLIPCPAAITVFILCLHLGKFTLGITLVGAFSIGLAATLVAVGVVAALGLNYISRRTTAFDRFMAAAPYLSGALVIIIGCLIFYGGMEHLTHMH